MKFAQKSLLTLASVIIYSHTSADVIYSNLLNTSIPLDFDGVTIAIGNGEINPFFGGVAVANDADLQPFRLGTGGLDTIRNFSHGTLINAGNTSLATGPGGSQDHLGTTFTAGQEGYMGFKLDNNKYGWARVIFTNNTGGALVKDWSYDNAGSGITVGGIRQVAQNIEISANFTLSSSLVNSGGVTNLVASNAGTTTLSANHTYTGTTTINSGSTLIINGATTTSGVSVAATGTLGGIGSIGSAAVSGVLAPGSSGIGTLTATGDVTWNANNAWVYELGLSAADVTLANTTGTRDLLDITGAASGFLKGTGSNFIFNFSNTGSAGHYKLVDWIGTTTFLATDFTAINLASGLTGDFIVDSTTSALYLNVVNVIPEPSIALLSGLGVLLLIRRRVRQSG